MLFGDKCGILLIYSQEESAGGDGGSVSCQNNSSKYY